MNKLVNYSGLVERPYQVGQLCCRSSQDRRQWKWKIWPQGSFFGVSLGPACTGVPAAAPEVGADAGAAGAGACAGAAAESPV